MGECHRITIQAREPQGEGRWRFRTRTEIRRDPKGGLVAEPPADQRQRIGDWQVADCFQSTIDGKLVPAVARSGVERGLPALLQAICRPGDD
jgi:hypothetical protein